MNMKDYEKQAEELNAKARRLEATMYTLKALEHCVRTGHKFEFWDIDYRNVIETGDIHVSCSQCGCEADLKGADLFYRADNEEGWGDLAGKKVKDLVKDIETPAPSPETTETDEKPSLPMENTKGTDGTYRVDVSEILGKKEE